MECVECKSKLVISKTGYRAENDDTPNVPTRMICYQELSCLNEKCERKGKVVDTIEHDLELS